MVPAGPLQLSVRQKAAIHVEAAQQNEIEVNAEITLQAASEADLDTLQKVTTFILDESLGRVSITSLGTHDAKYIKRIDKEISQEPHRASVQHRLRDKGPALLRPADR